ncbi:hypothetical protein [Streptomyces sp. NPDC057052]
MLEQYDRPLERPLLSRRVAQRGTEQVLRPLVTGEDGLGPA